MNALGRHKAADDHDDKEDDSLPDIRPIEDDSSSASSASSTGTIVPDPSKKLIAVPSVCQDDSRSREPIPWTAFFAQELNLEHELPYGKINYHAYFTPPSSATASALTLPFSPPLSPTATSPPPSGPLFVTHHGAGSSGLSFATLARELRQIIPNAGILSPDARGHGLTQVMTDPAAAAAQTASAAAIPANRDLALETLADDLVNVLRLTQVRMQWSFLPPIILVGHSLGGAVIAEVAARTSRFTPKPLAAPGTARAPGRSAFVSAAKSTVSTVPQSKAQTTAHQLNDVDPQTKRRQDEATMVLTPQILLGYVVLDVVEGSAIEALQSMQTYLSTRPRAFDSVETAIDWHIRTRTIRNVASARTSVPALLMRNPDAKACSPVNEEREDSEVVRDTHVVDGDGGDGGDHVNEDGNNIASTVSNAPLLNSTLDKLSALKPVPAYPPSGKPLPQPASLLRSSITPHWQMSKLTSDSNLAPSGRFVWRTDLGATEPFWTGWFQGLSQKFLGARGGKLLVLAGTDRLDTELTIGQMQGKYTLQVFPEAGHFVHEDVPEKTALVLADFYRRNDRSLMVLPPKVSDLLKMGKKV